MEGASRLIGLEVVGASVRRLEEDLFVDDIMPRGELRVIVPTDPAECGR